MNAEFPDALQFLFEPHRYKVAHGGRGGAKSWAFARALLIQGAQDRRRYVCARETMKSMKDSVHNLLRDQIYRLGLQDRYRVLDDEIRGTNGTVFSFAGLKHNVKNIKSLEGADVVWVEEAQSVSKDSWETLIPTVRKDYKTRGEPAESNHMCRFNGCCSEIWVSFNAELDTDDTYRRFVIDPPASAKVVKLTWRDNNWFPDVLAAEMAELKAKDEASYLHVWEGECRSSVEGAIYAGEIKQATQGGRICNVPVDRTRPVDTFWDLGFEDLTAVWFGQAVDGWFHFVDYLQDSGRTIEWYLIQLQQRGYLYGTDWLPHDALDVMIHHKLGGNRERSIEMIMRAAGRRVRLVPKMYVLDGINAARTFFPQCRFNADKCYEGLRALRMYQWGPIPASGKLRREPLHDGASHGADGFRSAAISFKQPRREEEDKPRAPSPQPRSRANYGPFG